MPGVTDKSRKPEKDWTPQERLELAKDNHLWINAFSAGRPTDELKKDIGEWVLRRLLDSEMSDDLSETFPVVYLTVNAS